MTSILIKHTKERTQTHTDEAEAKTEVTQPHPRTLAATKGWKSNRFSPEPLEGVWP